STEANGGGTIYKNGLTPKATAPATYYAYFTESLNKYKVTLLSNNSDVCTLFGAGTYEYGTTAHIFAKVRDGYEFVKWEWAETHTTNADLGNVEVQGDITYTAVVREAVVDKKVGIKSIYAVADGDIVKDLILESNGNASGQITNATALSVEGNAYFDLSLNADAQTWYAFGLPWQVDATSGVSVKGGAQLILDNTYHVLYYDGANRAQYGKANGSWKFLADKSDKTLEPGTLYLIYLNSAANTLRFTKKNGASINNISVMVEQYPSQTGDDKDANWNGIANPAVYYAYMNAGVEYGQHYNDGPFEMSTHKFIVGEPIFVQTPAKKSVVADNSQYPASAPRRNVVPENDNKAYEIRIAPLNAEFADRIYVRPAEEKWISISSVKTSLRSASLLKLHRCGLTAMMLNFVSTLSKRWTTKQPSHWASTLLRMDNTPSLPLLLWQRMRNSSLRSMVHLFGILHKANIISTSRLVTPTHMACCSFVNARFRR
ncbi:MAG: hypothetical protein IJ920_10570, partial [Paludibacteraceae bacterium]|nr:hypothetical protein [Paludibacteraceae bacterium]